MLMFAVFSAAVISFLTSFWFIRSADRIGLIDMPNPRSSHSRPTPRGGGIGIVTGMMVVLAACFMTGMIGIDLKYLVIISGFFAMALLGFCSDRFNISAIARIILQILIAVIMARLIGCQGSVTIAGLLIPIGRIYTALAVIWLVTVTNFYNFMDGIDGLAAMQGIIAGIGIAFFGIILGNRSLIPMGLVLSGASAGFLVLNFPPARIFMGDTGSYSVGLYIASFALIDDRLVIPIAMVLGVFIFDAAITLTKRVVNGEEWYRAHRSHFYQRAVKSGYSHLQVTLVISIVMAVLTAMACIYPRALPLTRIIILISASGCLFTAALWVILKEKTEKRTR